ncbi:protein kinase domain-containing protein [Nocardia sp. CWNU-33]|uniref:serine/threonine-protein kinase n=1 Tax=Nocardia sp. CWNU-33 TaxID=3392117 RepID=UPI00398F29A0
MLNSGEVFAGFTIERLLGQGGMGSVYLARHPRLSRQTALKLLNRELFTDAELRARFEREADLAAHLDHPNIVAVYDRGSEDDQLWISMQYIDGIDAATVNPQTLPPERAVQIIEGVAGALDYAHGMGVLHRDVKPANIMLARSVGGQGERVFLTDFGIARLREDSTHLTQVGMFTATLAYASPEQMTGGHLDHRSDQYSLACALYWLFTGMAPFDSPDPNDIIRGHLQYAAPPLATKRQGLNPALDGVLAMAMAKRPEHRFATCTEFAAAARRTLTAPASAVPAATVQVNPAYPPAGYPGPGPALAVPPANPVAAMPPGAPPHVPSAQVAAADQAAFAQQVPAPAAPSPGYGGAPQQHSPYPAQPPVNPGVAQPMQAASQHPGTSHPGAAPPGYPPPNGQNYGGAQPMPPSRSTGAIGWLVLGVVVAVVAVVAFLGVMAFDSDPGEDSAASPAPSTTVSTPTALPADPLAPSRRAFPSLLPQGTGAFGDAEFQDAECMARKPADGVRLKDELLQTSRWVVAWECSRDVADSNHMNYTILGYESAAAAQAVVAALPPNTATPSRKNGAGQAAHLWIVPDPTGPLAQFYHTAKLVVSFESDPARSNYLLYMSYHGTSGDPQTAPPSAQDAVLTWWAAAPL